MGAHASFPIARRLASGHLDSLHVDGSGLLSVEGWCREVIPPDSYPQLLLDGSMIPLLQHFRFARTDVKPSAGSHPLQTGVAWEYLVDEPRSVRRIELRLPGDNNLSFDVPFTFTPPHYDILYASKRVLHRIEIYGSGPPNGVVHPEVLDLAKRLPGPVLDFGCGRGTLVGELNAQGTQADGLELDSPILREAIPPPLRARITLYDGSLPTHFADASYRSVVCSEVLEHIPDYQAAVADMARIAREQVLITVPDASAIPTGHRHGIVPWHLLEGSHLNFFTQNSLRHTLEPHFKRIEFGRAGVSQINDTSFYVSLTAMCWK